MKLNETNYIERDVSWMYFNRRILDEAQRSDIPVMERLKFLGIYSNNLDEFFRVRVATLNRIVEYADKSTKDLRRRSEETLKTVNKLNAKYAGIFAETVADVENELKSRHINILKETDLDDSQQEFVREYFRRHLAGSMSPIWLSSVKALAASSDDAIYLMVRLLRKSDEKKKAEKDFAVIELPVKPFGRFLVLPDTTENDTTENDTTGNETPAHNVMYLDDVVRCCLPFMFPGTSFNHFDAWSFKITKDAEMEIESDIRGSILQKIAKGVKSRKNGMPVRLIYDKQMPREVLKRLMERLGLSSVDTMLPSGRYQNHKDLMKFPRIGAAPGDSPAGALEYPEWQPVTPPWSTEPSLIQAIRRRDRFLHVPYHSFDTYISLLREAAVNPEVKGIKTTLYRLAKDSNVVSALIAAARNGKKVTVVIELLARFDEESNIVWSKKMADAGINVITGVEGLKIHSKVTHISARYGDIAVVSTGNFHEGNARAYTDFLQFTACKPVVSDVARVFDFIEKPYLPVRFRELIVSPNNMRSKLAALVKQEIRNHQHGLPARILCKLNHITDEQTVKQLYEAAAAGVKVDLLVRGNCSLVSSLPRLGGNMRVNAIIDRYLEHSRILIFANGTDISRPATGETCSCPDGCLVFIGSADWMPRNLDHRIEVYAPVLDSGLKAEARLIAEYGMADDANTCRSQEKLYTHYTNDK